MSASERLKALDVPGQHKFNYLPVMDALPQIVAVVEAAEHEHPEPHNYWSADGTPFCPTCAALTALEEALS